MNEQSRTRRKRFTLLELLIVAAVLGAVAAVVIPRFTVGAAEARRNTCAQNVATINAQIERWHFEKGSWPANDLSDIGADRDYFPDSIPACPVDGSAYHISPASSHRVIGHHRQCGRIPRSPPQRGGERHSTRVERTDPLNRTQPTRGGWASENLHGTD